MSFLVLELCLYLSLNLTKFYGKISLFGIHNKVYPIQSKVLSCDSNSHLLMKKYIFLKDFKSYKIRVNCKYTLE